MKKMKFQEFMKQKCNQNLFYLLPTILWIVALTLLNFFCSSHVLNSDMSAELVLAKELSRENKFFTTQWFYSTEIRIFYTQIVSLFFFKIFRSWGLVRTATNLVFFIGLLASYLFAMKPLKISSKSVYLSSLFLFIPFSTEYINIVHIGNSYIPHFIVVFLCIGLLLRILEQKRKRELVFFILLSFYAGLCGIRFITIYAMPILLGAILKVVIAQPESGKSIFQWETLKKPEMVVPFCGFAACVLGFLVNVLGLSRIVSVGSTNDLLLNLLDENGVLKMTDKLIAGILRLFGYQDFAPLNSPAGISSITSVIMLVGIVIVGITLIRNYRKLSDAGQYVMLLFFMSLFTNTFIFLVLAGTYVPRFYMLTLILFTPCLAMFLEEQEIIRKDFNRLTVIFLIVSMNISGIVTYDSCVKVDQNAPFKEVVSCLKENNLSFGLTTFWNTGVVNELSDGQIECVNIRDDDITKINGWLTFKKYFKKETWEKVSNDRIFLLLDGEIYESFQQETIVQEGEQIYDENGYVILVYEKEYFLNTFGHLYFSD